MGDIGEVEEKKWEVMWWVFRVEVVGLMSVLFMYVGMMLGIMVWFVVEWGMSCWGCIVYLFE